MFRRSKLRREKSEQPGKAQDIFFSDKRKVLDLRPRRLGLKAGKREVLAFIEYAKSHRAVALGCTAILAVVLVAAIGRISYANNARFHPASCLGGWENPSHAQGQPEVSEGGTGFSSENSAVLRDAIATIYCGGFAGEIPKDTKPSKVEVVFSWHSQPATTVAPAPGPADSAPAGTSTPTENIEPAAESPVVPVPADSAPTAAPTEDPGAPVSWLAPVAYAQEVATGTEVDLLQVQYTLDGKSWNLLGTVSRAGLSNTRLEIPAADITGWKSIKNIQISVQSNQSVNGEPVVYLDSVGLEVDYENVPTLSADQIESLPRVEIGDSEIFSDPQKDFQSAEDPQFEIDVPAVTPAAATGVVFEDPASGLFTPLASAPLPNSIDPEDIPNKVLSAEIYMPDGSLSEDAPVITNDGDDLSISIPKHPNAFKPGLYKVKVEVLDGDKVLVSTHQFAWGVLAVNTDQSSYAPGDTAHIQISALDSQGRTLCNAQLRLVIEGKDVPLSQSQTCGQNNVTDNPDYFADYKTGDAGTYAITLTNLDNNFEIEDALTVDPDARYVVTRTAATRINPFASAYTMKIHVAMKDPFQGAISETVPRGFSVSNESPDAFVTNDADGSKKIVWPADIAAGETVDLEYTFQAPEISPELYVLGPLLLKADDGTGWDEGRSWQIASDAACNATATGNWGDGTKWSGCTGAAGVPAAADTVTINSGVIMTVTSTVTVTSVTVAANASSASNNGITIGANGRLNVTSTITMNAPTASTSAIAVGGGILQAQSIAITGSGTASRFATLSVATGTINTTSSITFSGTAAQARLTLTGTSTINIGGDLGAGGTLTTTGATSSIFNFNGTGAQTMNGYATYTNVQISNTSNTVTATGTITAAGTLTVATSSTLDLGVSVATISSTTNIFGTLNLSSATGAKVFVGAVNVISGGTWNNSGNNGPTFRGGITNNGTFTAGTGTHTFNTNNQSIGNGFALIIQNVTVTGVTLTNNNTTGFTASTTLSGTGGLVQATSSVLNIGTASAITTLVATTTGNTVNYTGVAQTLHVNAYYNLNMSGSGAKNMTSVTTINGNLSIAGAATAATVATTTIAGSLTVGSGTTYTIGAFGVTVTGTTSVSGTLAHSSALGTPKLYVGSVTVNSGGSWTNAGNGSINFRGGLSFDGTTFTSGTGLYTFDTNNQTIGGATAFTISSSTVTGITLTNNNTGGLSAATSLAGTGNFTQGTNGVLNIGVTTTVATFVASSTGNVVNYNGAAAQSIRPVTYYTLKSNNTNTTGAQLGGAITLTNLTVGDAALGVFDDNGNTITLNSGSAVIVRGGATYKISTVFPAFTSYTLNTTSTVQYQSASAQMVSAATAYGNLTIIGTSTKTVAGGLTIAGNLTVNAANVTLSLEGFSHSLTGNAVVTSGILNCGTSTLTMQGNISGAGNFNGATSTVNMTGGGTQTMGATTQTFYNLSLNKTAGTSASLIANATINAAVIVNTGTFGVGGITLTQNGTTTVSGTLSITSVTGTKTFVGLITISSGGVWDNTIGENITLRGGLTFNGATFTAGGGTYTFDTNSQALSGGNVIEITNVTVTGITLTNNSAAGFTASTTLAGTGGLVQATSSILNIGGTSAITTLVATTTPNTVNYTGGAQTVHANAYYNLGLAGPGASNNKTLTSVTTVNGNLAMSGTASSTTAAALTVSNTLAIGSGNTLNIGAFNFTVSSTTQVTGTFGINSTTGTKTFTGSVTIDPGGVWNNAANEDVTFQGGITNNGTFTAGTGVYTFDTNNQTIGNGSALAISSTTVTTITLTNNNTAGFIASTTLAGTGKFLQGANAVLNLAGTAAITSLVATSTGNTVTYTGTSGSQTVKLITYTNLSIDKSGQTALLAGTTTVTGNLSINAGTLDAVSGSNYGLTVQGNWTNNGTFTPRLGTVTFNGTGSQTINSTTTWYGLAITGSVARTVSFQSGVTQIISSSGSLTLNGAASQLLTLAPLTPASAWYLAVSTTSVTQAVSYVAVSYSNAGVPGTAATISAYDGTNTDSGNNSNWDFYGPISLSISDGSIGFGTLNSSAARYATGDTVGTSSVTVAHTITAGSGNPNGYTLTVQGATLTSGGDTINAIGASNTASVPGTEQFGLRMTAVGGPGTVTAPYAAAGFAYAASTSTSSQVASASSAGADTTYSVTYLANTSSATEAGSYSTTLIYTATGNF